MADIALALAGVKVPEVVVGTCALYADAIAGKCIKLFKFVVAVPHLISTRTVDVGISERPPDELAFWTDDQFIGGRVSARQKLSVNDGNMMLYFCLSKISAYLLFHSCLESLA